MSSTKHTLTERNIHGDMTASDGVATMRLLLQARSAVGTSWERKLNSQIQPERYLYATGGPHPYALSKNINIFGNKYRQTSCM